MSDDGPPIPAVDPEDRPVPTGRGRKRRNGGGRRPLLVRLLPLLIVVVALGSFAGIVGYYYFAGAGTDGVAPLIKADQQPFKIKPENPGGIEVPDQDKEIYNRVGQVERSSVPPPNAERLLPPPETPLPRPAPAASPAPPAQPQGSPANSNPNVGGAVLGAAPPARPSTLSAAPPRPANAPPPPVAAVPPTPDVAPPAKVASQTTLPAKPPQAPAATRTASATAPAAAPRPASGGPVVRVAVASVRSEPDAKKEWVRQQRLYPQALSGIVPEFAPINLGDRGTYWRIYIGPPEAGPEAQSRCAALKQKQVDCFVARP